MAASRWEGAGLLWSRVVGAGSTGRVKTPYQPRVVLLGVEFRVLGAQAIRLPHEFG